MGMAKRENETHNHKYTARVVPGTIRLQGYGPLHCEPEERC